MYNVIVVSTHEADSNILEAVKYCEDNLKRTQSFRGQHGSLFKGGFHLKHKWSWSSAPTYVWWSTIGHSEKKEHPSPNIVQNIVHMYVNK